ncbi:MAG: hypothetical protein KatS3mg076_1411 [Candidatus Binatia bacterium]|nr:MAG: hypothetical protein KatS3mg076_1411 [Candidatus Binatia bacterium]
MAVSSVRRLPAVALSVGVFLLRLAAAGELPAEGPSLRALHEKIAEPRWLVAYLLEPARFQPGTAMPDFDLEAREAQALARFLYGSEEPHASSPLAGDAERGRAIFDRRGCGACHATTTRERSFSGRVPNLASAGLKLHAEWTLSWLRDPRAVDPGATMPRFPLMQAEVEDVVAFLATLREGTDALAGAPPFDPRADATLGKTLFEQYGCGSCHVLGVRTRSSSFSPRTREELVRLGETLVSRYHCRACHRIGPEDPATEFRRADVGAPALDEEARRVRRSWLVAYLESPVPLRPRLEVPMPDYGLDEQEASAITAYLASLAGLEEEAEEAWSPPPELVQAGIERLAHYRCMQCHTTSSTVPPENRAIDLDLARSRLRVSWIRSLLRNPEKALGAGTLMPSVFYDAEGRPKVAGAEKEIEAITAALVASEAGLETAVARLEAERHKAAPGADIDWTKYEY